MKTIKKTLVEVAAYLSPAIEVIEIESHAICNASGDGSHEGVEYDSDEPIFGDNE